MSKEYFEKLKDPKWQMKRLNVFQRDNYTCKKCKETRKELAIHHLQYKFGIEPWEYKSDELITLCVDCHAKEHTAKKILNNLILEALKKGFLYSDILDIACVILRIFKDRDIFNYAYNKIDKTVSDIEQDLRL